jgi:hypothetical protein
MKIFALLFCLLIVSHYSYSFTYNPEKLSLQIAPVSFRLWGSTPSTISLQAQYRWLMLGYYHIIGEYKDELKSPTRADTFGAFYKPGIPIGKRLEVSPIVGVFNHRFPTKNGAWWAFGLNINYNVTKNFGFYVQHLSNAKTATINPGLDLLGMKYTF